MVTTTWIVLSRKLFVFLLAAASTNDAVALLSSSSVTSVSWSETSLFSRSPMLLPSDASFSAPTPTLTELSSSVVYRQQQQQQQRVSRAAFLRSIAFGGTAFLFGTPTLPATAKDNNPAAQIQAGLADLDRVVSKEANKIDRAATKEKKKMTKEIKKETKKIDKKIQKEVKKIEKKNPEVTKKVKKETKKVMREVDKKTEIARQETEKVKREAKKIGSGLEQKANALVGGTSGGAVAVPQARSGGGGGSGIDVSRLKVCGDGRKKVLSIRLKFQDMIYDPVTAGGVTPRFTTPPV
ncbi:hypothetical protein FRACYDRAFT_258791 [Fragilariopsis cylindrus CCMP1102]|uniref:Uncharacterized protein n=1 Tax=Fragilariopsis cylindrus CCMP1102 TaxID=635003 RepID=A0A1E7FUG0_9STRA|nr:hypothetical protein FRACYDRAFT_258791 [Fragilariopsis cylindrus CCMP1102]|eukprot:OEU21745.1 hypothetical protein FRACYDRAFT_258791 [Fragilariopsis cylindrus CCMP1102]